MSTKPKQKPTSKKLAIKPVGRWHKFLHILKRVVTSKAFIIVASLLVIFFLINSFAWQPVKNPQYGVSFSTKYAKELGSDWKANFTALLDDMHVKRFRLMSYWDDIEKSPGQYDFSELDWQFSEAAKRGAKVSLAIGLRQPRWPECHRPDWAKKLAKPEQNKELIKFLETTVNHYKNNPNLLSYQLENEALNGWFGECRAADIERERLVQEFDLVKKLDQNHPVYMSLSDQHGLPLNKPVPDKYGFSVYRVVYSTQLPIHFYITYPTPTTYHRIRAWLIKIIQHREVFVHELQLEPWGPKATKDLTVTEQNRSMDNEQMRFNLDFARRIGSPEIFVWGSEWWYWRMNHYKDPAPWDTFKQELQRYPN
ncbi:MAG: hypothetical protein WCP03_02805 [Candidatus Saccharibacteria bacterium]